MPGRLAVVGRHQLDAGSTVERPSVVRRLSVWMRATCAMTRAPALACRKCSVTSRRPSGLRNMAEPAGEVCDEEPRCPVCACQEHKPRPPVTTALLPPSRLAPARPADARSPSYPGPSRTALRNSTRLPGTRARELAEEHGWSQEPRPDAGARFKGGDPQARAEARGTASTSGEVKCSVIRALHPDRHRHHPRRLTPTPPTCPECRRPVRHGGD